MKAVILAGGRGTRISEESNTRPKPMIEIGGKPIIWHIMNIYAAHGVKDFIVCAGYKGYMLKEYFVNLVLHHSDVTVDMGKRTVNYLDDKAPDWKITVIDTGLDTMTGGRLKRVRPYLDPEEPFCMTYGDGVGDVDISAALAFHKSHGLAATMTTVRPPARFGAVQMDGDRITSFMEKHASEGGFINGGFFVLDPSVIDLVDGDATVWESEPLERLAAAGQLAAYRHTGFWQPMDTLREKTQLEEMWAGGKAPWKVWE
ncbi:MAG: glucose-1-phosphate cytidylyltransferase [Solirubrobacterales bacterium]